MGLPAIREKDLTLTPQEERFRLALIDRFDRGLRPTEIARELVPEGGKKRKAVRQELYRMVARDPHLQQMVAERTQAELIMGMPAAARGLVRRAASGRPDGIKLLFEAVNFYNPKVQHEHSGEVTIKMDLPRPTPVEEDIPDADVVE